jgi:hypothetical protein
MNLDKLWLPVVAMILLMAFSGRILHWRMERGDAFPAGSSLRTDPLGASVLYESLDRIPGMDIERNTSPYERLENNGPALMVANNVDENQIRYAHGPWIRSLEQLMAGGWTLLLTLEVNTSEEKEDEPEARNGEKKEAPVEKTEGSDQTVVGEKASPEKKSPAQKKKTGKEQGHVSMEPPVDLGRRWGFQFNQDGTSPTEKARDAGVFPWKSSNRFVEPSAPWVVLHRVGGQPVMIRKSFGRGSLIIASESYFLSNEAMRLDPAPAALSELIGSHVRVVFDEFHLGVRQEATVGSLLWRYRLHGFVGALIILAICSVWRMSFSFPPRRPEAVLEPAPTYTPVESLAAVLKRNLSAGDLAVALAQSGGVAADAGRSIHPVQFYNQQVDSKTIPRKNQ